MQKIASTTTDNPELRELLLRQAQAGDGDEQQFTSYADAGLLSLATFSWVAPLLKVGSKRPLDSTDLPNLAPSESAATVHQLMSRAWQANASSSYRLYRSLVSILWRNLAVVAALQLVAMICSYTGPYLMDDLVQSLGRTEGKSHDLIMLVLILLLSQLVGGLAQSQGILQGKIIQLRSKSALTALLYLKGLRLSSISRQAHGSGDIVNYMAVDTTGVASCFEFIHHLWRLPLEVVLALLILYKSVGIAAVATLVATVATIAMNLPYTSMQDGYQAQIMKAKDVRMRATAECLRSMKILKLQAWEEAYLNKLEGLRRTEYGWLRKISYNRAISIFLFYLSPAFVGIVTFGTCILLKVPLTTGRVLSALATFRVLQAPLSSFPDTLSLFVQARVSLRRLSNFLLEEELQGDAVSRLPRAGAGEFAIQVEGGAFSWDGSPERLSLSNADLHVWEGATVAVCGMVGSGKSSLLSCLLGQVPKLAGKVKLHGKVAYVGQTAWIQSGKVQDNILFGSPLDHSRYDEVLEMCQLKKDLEVLPYGDQTEIGERGINLSGGQKQRVQLARALYQDADVYLLDDPFSAVDVETGTRMFKEIVLKALALKTVVLVTHQVEFLRLADLILVLKDGCIVQQGTYQELLKSQADFNMLVHAHNKAMESVVDQSLEQQGLGTVDDSAAAGNGPQPKQANQWQQLVKEEEREKGSTHWALYWSYCTAYYKGALVPLILLGPLVFQVFQLAGNWWMAATSQLSVAAAKLIGVYVALTLGGSLFFLGRMVLIAIVGLRTSQLFFFNMLNCIFHAPMSFFDSTPAGRILSRASSDQSALDLDVPFRIAGLANSTTHFIFMVGVLSRSVWQVSVVFVPVAILCVKLQRYYMASARELTRLQGTHKAPIIHHFSESLAGAATIRGFDQEERFAKRSLALIDDFCRPDFYSTGAMEWVTVRLELLTNVIFAVFLFSLVYLSGSVNPSLAGLAVTYGLNMDLPWVLWCLCTVEKVIISVERIQQYSCLPSEAPWQVQATEPPESWPSDGNVELVDLQVRYTETSPLVLHGITCKFPGGKKIGVVGRTGGGKSTLIQAIFRVIEPAGGRIIIDGVDISRLGLHDLRSRLSIIPQDPVLFQGTVRYNLDPLGCHSDAELWEALDKSELGDLVRNKEGKLEASVSENGENWSVGQRQLFCLGRVMLKRARVLVLDEATASVDTATDAVLQSTIWKEFADCTVITIAHRLPTVIGSDLVLVINDGRVAEYDEPTKLLDKGSSHFSKLVNEYSASNIFST